MATEVARVDAHQVSPELPAKLESNIGPLLERAIEKGVDVALLERLVALQERIYDRDAKAAFLDAVARFQSECPPLTKSRGVDYTTRSGVRIQYDFTPLDVIVRETQPHLTRNELSYSWDSKVDGKQVAVTCTLNHTLGHSRSATFACDSEGAGSSTMNSVQKAGSAITYGQRYSLLQVLGLTTGTDTDGRTGDTTTADLITEKQVADLSSLMDEVKSRRPKFDRAKFLTWMGVESLDQIPAKEYRRAVTALEEQRDAA